MLLICSAWALIMILLMLYIDIRYVHCYGDNSRYFPVHQMQHTNVSSST